MAWKWPPSSSRPKCGKAIGLRRLLAAPGVHERYYKPFYILYFGMTFHMILFTVNAIQTNNISIIRGQSLGLVVSAPFDISSCMFP